jgi:hypothetical protein
MKLHIMIASIVMLCFVLNFFYGGKKDDNR